MIAEIVIAVLITAAAGWAIYKIVKKAKHGGGCCGEHEEAEARVAVKDKNKAHYPYAVDVSISGMTCRNCAKRVENALNTLDGVWARVDLNKSSARILSKREIDMAQIYGMIARAGYIAGRR